MSDTSLNCLKWWLHAAIASNSPCFSPLYVIQVCFLCHSLKFPWPAFRNESGRGRVPVIYTFLWSPSCVHVCWDLETGTCSTFIEWQEFALGDIFALWKPLPGVFPRVTSHALLHFWWTEYFELPRVGGTRSPQGSSCHCSGLSLVAWSVNASGSPSIISWWVGLTINRLTRSLVCDIGH